MCSIIYICEQKSELLLLFLCGYDLDAIITATEAPYLGCCCKLEIASTLL